jgi:subtilase family serine protease
MAPWTRDRQNCKSSVYTEKNTGKSGRQAQSGIWINDYGVKRCKILYVSDRAAIVIVVIVIISIIIIIIDISVRFSR